MSLELSCLLFVSCALSDLGSFLTGLLGCLKLLPSNARTSGRAAVLFSSSQLMTVCRFAPPP